MPSYPIIILLSSPQTVTASWVDIGAEVESGMRSDIGLWIKVTINDSANIDFRIQAKHTSGGDEYEIMDETIVNGLEAEDPQIHELNRDIDQDVYFHIALGGEIPFLQLQVKAGTVGATGATIDEVKYDIV